MKKEIIIDIQSDGQTAAMHFDQFDLGFLGKKHIGRASDIVWNEEQEWWEIIVAGQKEPIGQAACGFSSYEKAREFEVRWFQECRKRGIYPHSEKGEWTAIELKSRQ